MIDIEQQDDVAVVHWRDDANRFNRASVDRWHSVLDELDAIDGPLAVVVAGLGKSFSQGLDLDAFAADPDSAGEVVADVHRLFGRLLLFPAYCVAAIGGHAFAAGAMLTCAVDARVMRADRGWWCLPEVDLGLPLTPPMMATVTARMPRDGIIDAVMTGHRYTGMDALARGLVDEAVAEDLVLERAVARAEVMAAKDRRVIARHKRMLFGEAAALCGVGDAGGGTSD